MIGVQLYGKIFDLAIVGFEGQCPLARNHILGPTALVGSGLVDISEPTSATAPRRFHYISIADVLKLAYIVNQSRTANSLVICFSELFQQILASPPAVAHRADAVKICVGWQQFLSDSIALQLKAQRPIPSPRTYLFKWRKVLQVLVSHKSHIMGIATQVSDPAQCRCDIIDKDHIAILGPQRRQKTQVGAHLATCMRGHEIEHVRCKCYIVLGVKYM